MEPPPAATPTPLPVFLDVRGLNVLFVGAGKAARQKLNVLLSTGAQLTVVAPRVDAEVESLLTGCRVLNRNFQDEDLNDVVLVYAFTDDQDENARIAGLCRSRGLWHNIAGNRGPGAFSSPATAHSGDLTLAVGSGGRDIASAVRWRDRFASLWGQTPVGV